MESYTEKEGKVMDILEFIGMHKNERIIYLDLLKHGPSTAVDISKRTRIHRPNTYDALRKLIDKGFISQTRTPLKNFFQAMEVQKIKDYIDQKKQEIEEILPTIQEFSKRMTVKEDVRITKGGFAAREALLDLLELNSVINVYGASNEAVESFGVGFLKDFHNRRIKKKITMKHIYNGDASDRIRALNKMKYTEAKHLSKHYDTLVATVICQDTVLLLIFSNPVSVITIKRQEIADAYTKYFEILWSRSKVD